MKKKKQFCQEDFKVWNGANFEPAVLGGGVGFKVEGEGRGKAGIAAAEAQDGVGQFEVLE